MLAQEITYEDFNGHMVTETFYFNLTKAEMLRLQVSVDGGMQQLLQKIVDSQDVKSLIHEFEKLVLAAYGIKSEDGKKFIKNDELREDFKQTAAYDAIFTKIATDEKFAAAFVVGTFPKDLDLQQAIAEAKAQNAVPAPLPPPADRPVTTDAL